MKARKIQGTNVYQEIRTAKGEICQGCEDGTDEGRKAIAVLSFGPLYANTEIALCHVCIVRLGAGLESAFRITSFVIQELGARLK